ncbi:hemerythrin domain-containing protein [Neisseria leonii]|uniref:hemerythrin domain-containing protein n=1 Tax=Neisseria leonii TaxID=2995413 RepID=UPI00237A89CD|nr:hemerythrin domain-containing protein [Neisseria sp. 3986]MDD9326605.1 hemerythrin domain-containing protein [Neisseria sp. 3986]
MKRHPLLVPLSQEHHHSLALCLRILRAPETDHRAAIAGHFATLLPHFAEEERQLSAVWPHLRHTGLQQRFEADHAALRSMRIPPDHADAAWQTRFAALLRGHVRFEERELFPAAEPFMEAV